MGKLSEISRKKAIIFGVGLTVAIAALVTAVVLVTGGSDVGGGSGNGGTTAQSSAGDGGDGGSDTASPTNLRVADTTMLPTFAPTNAFPTIPATGTPTTLEPTNIPTSAPTPEGYYENFNFILMGDTPYVPKDRDLLLQQMQEIRDMVDDQLADPSLSQSLFVMHVGDIQHGKKTNCVEEFFTRMYLDIKYESPLPFLLLVGDNDWNDCPNPAAAKKISDDLFIGLAETHWLDWVFEQNFTNVEEVTKYIANTTTEVTVMENVTRTDVTRRSIALPDTFQRMEAMPENWVIDKSGILIISVMLVQLTSVSDNEFMVTIDQQVKWVMDNINKFKDTYGETPRALVMLGHPMRRDNIRPFFNKLEPYFYDPGWLLKGDVLPGMDFPVLYFHGDGHNWEVDTRLQLYDELNWELFYDVMCDMGGKAPPITLEFRGSDDAPFVQERTDQFIIPDKNGEGIIRIDRRGGTYNEARVYEQRYPWPLTSTN